MRVKNDAAGVEVVGWGLGTVSVCLSEVYGCYTVVTGCICVCVCVCLCVGGWVKIGLVYYASKGMNPGKPQACRE
ncbi:hypothetical protein B0H67DRAFT_576826 [Lasiosphaeris hirsuta]|uniref:Transmembrane protein n=1 Tax=Lasiosphaeris hirsuta TaxID=260670 RepID=A0AA40DY03_9PEZI|nr:hypothetical protein B0H67DRAFT_576826 [Lasiosphaeris hirsuta]